MYFLDQKIWFPHVSEASSDGLLAIGGDLSVERLIYAYQLGIFPWYEDGGPILWWSPDPRFVLFPEELKVSKSMRSVLKKKSFMVTRNKAFKEVVMHCSGVKRREQQGTWITPEMVEAYIELNKGGYAESYEVWRDDQLVGGLYGVNLGNGVFCGESMFSLQSNASKVAFISLAQSREFQLIDCQLYTKHLESLGARNIPRLEFLKYLVH
jgi:leucyl/phenylalanyl-tRNA--protein transferase